MPRKGPIPKRVILPDPVYGSQLVTRFINRLMYGGKKSVVEGIFFQALDFLSEKTQEPALKSFEQAVDNVRPQVEVKSRRVGGATYQVPVEVASGRQTSLAIRWLINYSRNRGEKGMVQRLGAELLDAYNNRGGAVKKREETHKMADANKAFAHFRW